MEGNQIKIPISDKETVTLNLTTDKTVSTQLSNGRKEERTIPGTTVAEILKVLFEKKPPGENRSYSLTCNGVPIAASQKISQLKGSNPNLQIIAKVITLEELKSQILEILSGLVNSLSKPGDTNPEAQQDYLEKQKRLREKTKAFLTEEIQSLRSKALSTADLSYNKDDEIIIKLSDDMSISLRRNIVANWAKSGFIRFKSTHNKASDWKEFITVELKNDGTDLKPYLIFEQFQLQLKWQLSVYDTEKIRNITDQAGKPYQPNLPWFEQNPQSVSSGGDR